MPCSLVLVNQTKKNMLRSNKNTYCLMSFAKTLGAASTSSLASLSPNPEMARISLMTLIFALASNPNAWHRRSVRKRRRIWPVEEDNDNHNAMVMRYVPINLTSKITLAGASSTGSALPAPPADPMSAAPFMELAAMTSSSNSNACAIRSTSSLSSNKFNCTICLASSSM